MPRCPDLGGRPAVMRRSVPLRDPGCGDDTRLTRRPTRRSDPMTDREWIDAFAAAARDGRRPATPRWRPSSPSPGMAAHASQRTAAPVACWLAAAAGRTPADAIALARAVAAGGRSGSGRVRPPTPSTRSPPRATRARRRSRGPPRAGSPPCSRPRRAADGPGGRRRARPPPHRRAHPARGAGAGRRRRGPHRPAAGPGAPGAPLRRSRRTPASARPAGTASWCAC